MAIGTVQGQLITVFHAPHTTCATRRKFCSSVCATTCNQFCICEILAMRIRVGGLLAELTSPVLLAHLVRNASSRQPESAPQIAHVDGKSGMKGRE